MNTAQPIKKHLDGWAGHATFYKVDPPIGYEYTSLFFGVKRWKKTQYVIVSSAFSSILDADETCIFPAYESGEQIQLVPLLPCRLGVKDHEAALNKAGYEVIK